MKYDTLLKFCIGELEAKHYEQTLTLNDLERVAHEAVTMLKPQVLLSINLAFLQCSVRKEYCSIDALLRDNIKHTLTYDLNAYLANIHHMQVTQVA